MTAHIDKPILQHLASQELIHFASVQLGPVYVSCLSYLELHFWLLGWRTNRADTENDLKITLFICLLHFFSWGNQVRIWKHSHIIDLKLIKTENHRDNIGVPLQSIEYKADSLTTCENYLVWSCCWISCNLVSLQSGRWTGLQDRDTKQCGCHSQWYEPCYPWSPAPERRTCLGTSPGAGYERGRFSAPCCFAERASPQGTSCRSD